MNEEIIYKRNEAFFYYTLHNIAYFNEYGNVFGLDQRSLKERISTLHKQHVETSEEEKALKRLMEKKEE